MIRWPKLESNFASHMFETIAPNLDPPKGVREKF